SCVGSWAIKNASSNSLYEISAGRYTTLMAFSDLPYELFIDAERTEVKMLAILGNLGEVLSSFTSPPFLTAVFSVSTSPLPFRSHAGSAIVSLFLHVGKHLFFRDLALLGFFGGFAFLQFLVYVFRQQ